VVLLPLIIYEQQQFNAPTVVTLAYVQIDAQNLRY
jgi:hypothetical protein